MKMDVSNRTVEDVLIEVLESGNLKIIGVLIFILGFIAGAFIMWLYCKKIRHHQLENKVSDAERELEQLKKDCKKCEGELKESREKLAMAEELLKGFEDKMYAKLACGKDAVPLPPDEYEDDT